MYNNVQKLSPGKYRLFIVWFFPKDVSPEFWGTSLSLSYYEFTSRIFFVFWLTPDLTSCFFCEYKPCQDKRASTVIFGQSQIKKNLDSALNAHSSSSTLLTLHMVLSSTCRMLSNAPYVVHIFRGSQVSM